MEIVCVIRIVFCKKPVCKIGSFIGIPKSFISDLQSFFIFSVLTDPIFL